MKKKQRNKKARKYYLLVAVIFVCFGAVITFNAARIVKLNLEASIINAYLHDPVNIEQARESKIRLESMKIIEEYTTITAPLVERLEKASIIDKAFMEKIAVAKTGVATVNVMDYDKNIMLITGIAADEKRVAAFEYKLKISGLFKSVKVLNMNLENGQFKFNIECQLEGGEINATNP